MSDHDTICALATAVGGAIAVIRLSGSEAIQVAERVWQGERRLAEAPARQLLLGRLLGSEGEGIDPQCLAVRMPGPNSYTGEDVVELQCHGGALVARLALQALLRQGARHAEPGEFTRRAFLHGKIDLTQAEAVADLIAANSQAAVKLADRQLRGLLGQRISAVDEQLTAILAEIESHLDFPEEDLDWQPPSALASTLVELGRELELLLATRADGEVLRGGISLVIAGPPNVGKSSLLNAILHRDRAIVSEIPGTTRDTIEEMAHIRGIPIRLMDTAGIREGGDIIEQAGISRAREHLLAADLVLWVMDASQPYAGQAWPEWPIRGKVIPVANKRDKMTGAAMAGLPASAPAPVYVCALDGGGLEELYTAVEQQVWSNPWAAENEVAVAARHAASLEIAVNDLAAAAPLAASEEWELAAVHLRSAIHECGQITGRTADPDLLGMIFARFCIGK